MYTISSRRWNQLRCRGMLHFIWSEGLLFWTCLGGLLFTVLIIGIPGLSWKQRLMYSLTGLLGLVISGFLYGVMVWREQKKIQVHDEQDAIFSREITKLRVNGGFVSNSSIESMFDEKPEDLEIAEQRRQHLVETKSRYEEIQEL